MMKSTRIKVVLIFAIISASDANAGAWRKERAQTELIVNSFILADSETTDKGALEIYSENGIMRGFSIVNEANIQIEADRAISTISAHSLKYARGFNDNWSAAIMFGADIKIADIETGSLEIGPTARAMIGRGFQSGIWLNGEIGARIRDDEPSYFGEISLGKRFKNQDMLISKYMSEGGYLSNFGSNLQVSYVKNLSKGFKYEVGYREAIGRNSRPRNSGFILGVWWQK